MQIITNKEKAQIEAKLEELKAKRPVLTKRIAEARALGDLKENADYHAAREDQGLNEAEIRRLEEKLATAQVTGDGDASLDIVFLGATVKLRDLDSQSEDLYKLVGESSGSFSFEFIEVTAASPMGEALLKVRVGESIRVNLPKGVRRYEVIEIV